MSVTVAEDGALEVAGLTAEQIGEAAARHAIVLHELTPERASLEEAFMDVTRDAVQFHAVETDDPPARQGARMSSVGATPTRPQIPAWEGKLRVTQLRVVLSEWTKLRSLRSTVWSMLVAVVFTIGLPALFAAVISSRWSHMRPGRAGQPPPARHCAGRSQPLQLAIGVLGVLVITGEYSTG